MALIKKIGRILHPLPELPEPGSDMYGKVRTLDLDRKFGSPSQLEEKAKTSGIEAGRDEVGGQHHGQTIGEHQGHGFLVDQVDGRIAEIETFEKGTKRDLTSVIRTTERVLKNEQAQERDAREDVRDLEKVWDRIPKGRGGLSVPYFGLLLLLGLAEFPSISAAVQAWPFDATTGLIVAIIFSLVFAAAAHYLSKRIFQAIEEVRKRKRDTAILVRDVTMAVVLVISVALLMAYLAFSRGASFELIAEATGNAFSEPDIAAGALFAVQLLLFVIAIAAGLEHAEGDEERTLKKKLKKARKHLELKQRDVSYVESRLFQLQEELRGLPAETDHQIKTEEQLKKSVLRIYKFNYDQNRTRSTGPAPIAPVDEPQEG